MASSSKNLVIQNTEASFDTDGDRVIVEVRSPDVDLQVINTDLQIPEIYAWKLQASDILLSQTLETIKIHVHRNRLMEQSTYFQSLFGGSFIESSSDYIVIQWNLPTFVALLHVIYGAALNLSFTNLVPILEVVETRFASHTIVLRRLVRVKEALCQMVISNKWGGWKQVDTEKAKIVKDLIFSDDFWNRVEYALELTEPLMSMLRYADTDEPCLGNIYDAMDSMLERMKSVIQRREQDPDTLYSTVEKIVLHRWNKMTTPLHLLAYALSPRYYSSEILDIPGRVPPYRDPEVAAGYKRALNRLFSDPDVASNVRREFVDFVSGKFAEPDAINDQSRLDAIGWWYLHGERYMYLQPLAIKILSQGALFFGVNNVIMDCKNWSIQKLSSKKTKFSEMFLRQLIDVWNFGADNGIHFILELYTDFFAMNFVINVYGPEQAAVVQCNYFVALPYALLNACISHPLLTVDSEKQLCEAVLNWLASNEQCSELNSHETMDKCFQILEKVRVGLLPLEFILGRLWRDYPSMVAALQETAMFDQISRNYCDIQFEDPELFRLRLTQYSEKLDLSGCQQVTGKVLFFSSLCKGMVDTGSSSLVSSETLKKLVGTRQTSEEVQWPVLQKSHLVTSLSNLQEVIILQCWRLKEEDIIDWLQLLSPPVRIFKSRYCSQIKVSILDKLAQACPLIEEVDLSVDISPVAACKVSVLHASYEAYPSCQSSNWVLLHKTISCNLTRLSLKGRADIRDSDLMTIMALSHSISVLSIDGCTSLTDQGISCFLNSSRHLHSLHAALTSFGQHSIKSLLSVSNNNDNSIMREHDFSLSLHSSFSLVELDLGGCNDIDQAFLINYMACASSLCYLSLRHTKIGDEPLYAFKGTLLKELDVCETLVSGAALCYIISRNPELHVLNARGCKRLSNCQLLQELDGLLSLKELAVGWGLSGLSLEMMRPVLASLKSLTVGLGGSLGTQAWLILPTICPLLEHISVCFQVVSDEGIINALKNLKYMHTLELQNCFGELSSNILSVSASNLKSLRLDRLAYWMTDSDLAMLTQNCRSLCQLSLAGCKFLTSDAQNIIASGWPGLRRIHLENCSKVTANGVSHILECRAMEDLLLRHNGSGIQRNFILKAALKLPLLRTLSLDLCDACESGFDTPHHLDRFSLCTVKLARCKVQRCAFEIENSSLIGPRILQPYCVHKDTIVLEWNSIEFKTTIVEERI